MVNTTDFIKSSILTIRDILRTNLTDPLNRATPFVFTSKPQEDVVYPFVIIKSIGPTDVRNVGLRSSLKWISIPIEVRIWAKREEQKDSITSEFMNILRTKQFGTGGTSDDENLHDFEFLSSVPVDEPGQEGIQSQVIQINYKFMLGA